MFNIKYIYELVDKISPSLDKINNSLKNTSFIQRQIDKIKKSTPITNTYRNFKSYFNDITNYINKTSIRVNLEKEIVTNTNKKSSLLFCRSRGVFLPL